MAAWVLRPALSGTAGVSSTATAATPTPAIRLTSSGITADDPGTVSGSLTPRCDCTARNIASERNTPNQVVIATTLRTKRREVPWRSDEMEKPTAPTTKAGTRVATIQMYELRSPVRLTVPSTPQCTARVSGRSGVSRMPTMLNPAESSAGSVMSIRIWIRVERFICRPS